MAMSLVDSRTGDWLQDVLDPVRRSAWAWPSAEASAP